MVKADGSHEKPLRDSDEQSCSESDAAVLRALDGMQDHVFCERFKLPPEKVTLFAPQNFSFIKGFIFFHSH